MRKRMASQMVGLVTVARNACWRPEAVRGTLPIRVMPRLRKRSPALAHATMMRIMKKVLRRRRWSRCISLLYGKESWRVAGGAAKNQNKLPSADESKRDSSHKPQWRRVPLCVSRHVRADANAKKRRRLTPLGLTNFGEATENPHPPKKRRERQPGSVCDDGICGLGQTCRTDRSVSAKARKIPHP